LRKFDYLEPKSLNEACAFLSEYGEEAKILAGGTALLIMMKQRLLSPRYVVNLKTVPDLAYIKEGANGLKIGALATHRMLEKSQVVGEKFSPLIEMMPEVASPRIRNMGTVAGNLCHAEAASDPPPLFLALGARLKAVSVHGERVIPLSEFFVDYYQTSLGPEEIVTEIQVPPMPPRSVACYLRFTFSSAMDKPAVSLAVAGTPKEGANGFDNVNIFLGAVGPTPIHAQGAEEALVQGDLERAAQEAARAARPVSDVRGSEGYKREIVKVLLNQAIATALERARRQQEKLR
jgi:carbon-monoxide dehydrogenase medium subunit